MRRFISLSLFLIIAIGLVLHFDVQIPWIAEWVGKLPGDLVIKKKGIILYFPITTSVLLSLALSFILSLLFGREK